MGAGAGPGAAAGGDLLALHDLLPDLHLHAAQVAVSRLPRGTVVHAVVQHQIVAVVLIIVVLGHGAVGGGQYGGALRGRQVYAGAVLGESAAHPHIVRKVERQRKDNGLRPLAAQCFIHRVHGIV